MIRKILLLSLLLMAEPAFAQIHDVGVVSIDSPPDIVLPNVGYTPIATVQNFGDFTETFPVACVISPGYFSQTEVDSLLPGEQVQVSFLDWVAGGECSAYWMTVFTSLSGDANPGNDTLFKAIISTTHEVGVLSIDAPPDTVFGDSTYLPMATVENLGFVNETFEVECLIDSSGLSVYGDTVQLTDLPPSTSFPCTFGVWTVPPSDSTAYSMTVSLLASEDCDPSNNSLQKPIFAYNPHDVGVDSILSPPDTVMPGSAYWPIATARNYGEVSETFNVVCEIDSNGYADTVWVRNLAPDSVIQCTFWVWVSPPPGPWTMCVHTVLNYDRDSANDTLCKTMENGFGVEELPSFHFPITTFQVHQNTPNPFTHTTTIRYSVPGSRGAEAQTSNLSTCQLINLSVYDISGKLARTLVDERQRPGSHRTVWDGMDVLGRRVPGGVYFCRLTAGDLAATKKLVIIR